FGCPEFDVLAAAHTPGALVRIDVPAEILNEILEKEPFNCIEAIKYGGKPVLPSELRPPILPFMIAKPAARFEIVVPFRYIGVSMMQNLMLDMPEEARWSE